MDRAIHAAASEQRLVGGVDDRVDVERGDVAFDDLDMHGDRRWIAAIHGVTLQAPDRPARPSMAGRSAGHGSAA
jgi:hypothetical protein